MGKPGGFFKKLKAKQKKEANRQRRGTRGASKEERRLKHNEKVEYYAAKREAEELAAVSSSSEDEASTDSEEERSRQEQSLHRLRALLGVAATTTTAADARVKSRSRHANGTDTAVERKRMRKSGGDSSSSQDHDDDNEDDASDVEGDHHDHDGDLDPAGDGMMYDLDAATAARRRRRRGSADRVALAAAAAADDDDGGDDDEDVEEEADWQQLLGTSDHDSDASSDDEGGDSDDEEEDGGGDDDLLLVDGDDDDDEEEEEEGENPFDEMLDDDAADALFDADLIDPEEFEEEEDEEEEDEEDEREASFHDSDPEDEEAADADEDDDDDATRRRRRNAAKKAKDSTPSAAASATTSSSKPQPLLADSAAHRAHLLPAFQPSTSAYKDLKDKISIRENDPWRRRYHDDVYQEIDDTPMRPVPLSTAATAALAASNAPRRAQAEERAAALEKRSREALFFVRPEDYEAMEPENVSVVATERARRLMLHAPFQPPAAAAAAAASSTTTTTTTTATDVEAPPFMHEALWPRWCVFRARQGLPALTSEERGLLDLLQAYPDLMDGLRCWQNGSSRREIYCLHLLNHWFKARSVVVAHDGIIEAYRQQQQRRRRRRRRGQKSKNQQSGKKKQPQEEDAEDDDDAGEGEEMDILDNEDYELRDRGFGKTRLLVMLPMRNIAREYVHTLVGILGAAPHDCPKLDLFDSDFAELDEAVDPTFFRRPKDYRRQFDGNIDDTFCVGIRLEPHCLHVYSHPLNSDLIICSPLGLRRRIERNGDVLVSLSAIEVCLVDEAHVLLQQNWSHVSAVLEMLNKRPTDTTHGLSDLRRVYAWALAGKSGRHRQTIVSSNLSHATLLGSFRSSVSNVGKVMLQPREVTPGALARVTVPVRQHFIRFDPSSLEQVDDDRFTHFTQQIYAAKINPLAERDVRMIIFVPSYFDFVRLRNYLHREYRESFAAISEYTSIKQQRRALGQFTDLERPVLLMTERFYFFKRYFVKMAEAIIFYSPPVFPEFYTSLVNRLSYQSPNAFALTLFCRYDTHELNRIAGTQRMRQLLERESNVFSFVTS